MFGRPVVSPCSGEVIAAGDHLPDLGPPAADRDNAIGNHVILDCGAVNVKLAHLKQASVKVAASDMLAVGELIGQVGNSGNTTEPHLHVHAVDPETGAGVPMSFDDSIPVRNCLFIR